MYSSVLIDTLFSLSAAIIWFMIAYQLALFLGGYWYSRKALRAEVVPADFDWPAVSILVPARNEATVIARTLESLCAFDYPHERMEIVIVDDGSSDGTGDIVRQYGKQDSRVRCLRVPEGKQGRGKAAALDLAIEDSRHELIAIYDADNRPEPASLRILVAAMVRDPRLAAAVGKFRCINRRRNLLTRFINIESLAFQWIIQAGRWALMRMASLPGTNFVIRRDALKAAGGWDHDALTEDAELTIRIYETGRQIRFVPAAVTWEQEPEKLRVWFRQRVRWARGHNYVMAKHSGRLLKVRPRILGIELAYNLILYYAVCTAIAVSDILLLLTAARLISIHAIGPYKETWILALLLFMLEVGIALSNEQDEDTMKNLLLVALAYFTYCQLWMIVVFRAIIDDAILRRKKTWAKTERFAEVQQR